MDKNESRNIYQESADRHREFQEQRKQRALERVVGELDLRGRQFSPRREIVEGLFHAGETGLPQPVSAK